MLLLLVLLLSLLLLLPYKSALQDWIWQLYQAMRSGANGLRPLPTNFAAAAAAIQTFIAGLDLAVVPSHALWRNRPASPAHQRPP
jgi:hypothetical protein